MSLSIFEDMRFDDENIVATYIIGNYEKDPTIYYQCA